MEITPSIFTDVINSYLPEPEASLLNGILFGISLKTSKIFFEQLRTVGLLHLVVLSGANISLLAGMVGQTARYVGKKTNILITVIVVVLFIVFVGCQAPVVRAGFMAVFTYVAIVFGKKRLMTVSLILSLLFIAVFWPQWLTSLSLLLSYGATLGIILFHRETVFRKNRSRSRLANFVGETLAGAKNEFRLSLSAQVFTAPIIFIAFRQISFISPVANVLVAWLVAPLMVFGFLAAIIGRISPVLGWLPAIICYGLLTYMVWIVRLLAGLPFASMNL